ncbi:MAG: S24 family peptidase [Pseudomonadota bacterium]
MTDADLAPAFGVERSVANKIANGKVPLNARRVDAVAKLLKLARDEVLFRFGISTEPPHARPQSTDDDEIEMVGIRHADAAFGMGAVFADDERPQVDVLKFPKIWVETITYSSPNLLSWVRARGHSMAPTIHDGDMILLDHSERDVKDQDDLWAFTVDGTRSIKRLRVKGDRFQILSDNPSVPPDEEPIDFVHIVGRVIFIGRRT